MKPEVAALLKRPIIEIGPLAKAIGWSTRRLRNTLKAMGAVSKVQGKWITTRGRLRAHFPELLEALEEADEDRERLSATDNGRE